MKENEIMAKLEERLKSASERKPEAMEMRVKDFKQIAEMDAVKVWYKNEEYWYYDFLSSVKPAKEVWEMIITGLEPNALTRVKKNSNEKIVIPYTLLYLADEEE